MSTLIHFTVIFFLKRKLPCQNHALSTNSIKAKPFREERQRSGLGVLSQTFFLPSVYLAFCHLQCLMRFAWVLPDTPAFPGSCLIVAVIPVEMGHRADMGAELWKTPQGGHHVAVGFQQPGVICKIRILIWKVDPIWSAVLLPSVAAVPQQ